MWVIEHHYLNDHVLKQLQFKEQWGNVEEKTYAHLATLVQVDKRAAFRLLHSIQTVIYHALIDFPLVQWELF